MQKYFQPGFPAGDGDHSLTFLTVYDPPHPPPPRYPVPHPSFMGGGAVWDEIYQVGGAGTGLDKACEGGGEGVLDNTLIQK
jgi:hypothetical protein